MVPSLLPLPSHLPVIVGLATSFLKTSTSSTSPLSQVQDEARRAYGALLDRQARADRLRAVLGVMRRYEAIVQLPARVRRHAEGGDYEQVAADYRRARVLLSDQQQQQGQGPQGGGGAGGGGSGGSMWAKLMEEVDKVCACCGGCVCVQCVCVAIAGSMFGMCGPGKGLCGLWLWGRCCVVTVRSTLAAPPAVHRGAALRFAVLLG